MPYIRLNLPDNRIGGAISMVTECHLEQAYYLMAATPPSSSEPKNFGRSAAVMLLLTIAAASAIRYFEPKKNKKKEKDRAAFVNCVQQFFPWDRITITDDQLRSPNDQRQTASEDLYDVLRNPMVHSGGVSSKPQLSGGVGSSYRTVQISHVFPGLDTPHDNEQALEAYCASPLNGDVLIELTAIATKVHTRPLYMCTRHMIETMAIDPNVQTDIKNNFGL